MSTWVGIAECDLAQNVLGNVDEVVNAGQIAGSSDGSSERRPCVTEVTPSSGRFAFTPGL